MTDKNLKYALLDFDGYICKAFYASRKKSCINSDPFEILNRLIDASIRKAAEYYHSEDVKVIAVVSSHSWKKDSYSQYKATRKKNDELGAFRDKVISTYDCVKIEQLEADEVILILSSYLDLKKYYCNIVFSDDKDLKYYSSLYCKINIDEQIQDVATPENWVNAFAQMLAGDKEDNITGIPKVGMKTALKLIENLKSLPDVKDIVKIYRDKNILYQDCLDQLAMVIPAGFSIPMSESESILCEAILNDEYNCVDSGIVQDIITSTLNKIEATVKSIYGKD